MKQFALIVAFDEDYGIGKAGMLPWHLPADLKHFKAITSTVQNPAKKNALIMGRKTWDSLPVNRRPLAGRVNVVLSRSVLKDLPDGVLTAESLDQALNLVSLRDIESVFVIGGAQVYSQASVHPLCQKLYVTHIKGHFNCDTFFPPISKDFFPISATEFTSESGIIFQFSEYLRY